MGGPVIVQRQLEGSQAAFVEKVHAIDALFTFATLSTEEESQRRVPAMNALVALRKKHEIPGSRRRG